VIAGAINRPTESGSVAMAAPRVEVAWERKRKRVPVKAFGFTAVANAGQLAVSSATQADGISAGTRTVTTGVELSSSACRPSSCDWASSTP
jgi:hypothetical protein